MKYEVRTTSDRGRGIFSTGDIDKDETVLTFRGNHIISKNDHHTLQIDFKKHLVVKGIERYVNHSCDPNCGIKDKITLVAMRPIKLGEEITFDYAMTEFSLSGLKCYCGAKNCRGKILGYQQLPNEVKEKYRGYFSDYLCFPPKI